MCTLSSLIHKALLTIALLNIVRDVTQFEAQFQIATISHKSHDQPLLCTLVLNEVEMSSFGFILTFDKQSLSLRVLENS